MLVLCSRLVDIMSQILVLMCFFCCVFFLSYFYFLPLYFIFGSLLLCRLFSSCGSKGFTWQHHSVLSLG